jgi:outer membrane protein OmpA-like peptidoglycan-associated protein
VRWLLLPLLIAPLGFGVSSSVAAAQSRLRVDVHVDAAGSNRANHELSLRRAEAGPACIAALCGVATNRVEVVAMGSDDSLAPTGVQPPEWRIRRVLMVSIGS